jgi:hypothetical protein
MRGHFAGARAAVFCAAVLTSLTAVGSAFAVTVSSFTPNSGLPNKAGACPGGTIMITGTGFAYDGGTVTVTFNGTPTQPGGLQIGSDTTLYAVVPDGASSGPITVTTGKGSATTTTSFYVNPCPQIPLSAAGPGYAYGSTPTVYGIKPGAGKVGTKVQIIGFNMFAVTKLAFGSATAKFTYVSPTEIDAVVPKGATSGRLGLGYAIADSTSQGGITPTNAAGGSKNPTAVTYSVKSFKVLK